MKWLAKIVSCIVGVAFTLPTNALADISVVQQGTRSGISPDVSWTSKIQIRGLKMRIETQNPTGDYVSIIDLEAGKRFRLDEKQREVTIVDLASESERMRGRYALEKLSRDVKPTGKHLEVSGLACDEYKFDLKAPSRATTNGFTSFQHDHGTVCVSQTIPGGTELTNYVHEAQKRGYFVAAPDLGTSTSPLAIFFYQDQPSVLVLSLNSLSGLQAISAQHALTLPEKGVFELKRTVLSISTEPVPDENFQVPSSWKVKNELPAK